MSLAWEDYATEERQDRLFRLQHPWLVRGVWLCLAGWCMGCWWLLLRWVVWMTFHW